MPAYTLAQIKAHPNFPFSDFRENPMSFLMLELYWIELFAEVIGDAVSEWNPLSDAEPDGNPILSLVNLSHARALRVIQKVNEDSKPAYPEARGEGAYYGLQAWLNLGRTSDGEVELNELVLFADLEKHTEREARALITLHCVDLAHATVVEEAIRAYENRVGMPE
jgi:hypothetical protein